MTAGYAVRSVRFRLIIGVAVGVPIMPKDHENLVARFARWWFCRRMVKALALNKRPREVRRDGLSLSQFCNRLQIEWRARDVHPWDRDRSPSVTWPAIQSAVGLFVTLTLTNRLRVWRRITRP